VRTKEIDKDFLMQLANRIKQLRIDAGYSNQETFSFDCNIPRAQYARYEKGNNITFLSLLKITKFHKLELHEFFSEGFSV
jgi:transcriptional regulator with XRE-family HTH domain